MSMQVAVLLKALIQKQGVEICSDAKRPVLKQILKNALGDSKQKEIDALLLGLQEKFCAEFHEHPSPAIDRVHFEKLGRQLIKQGLEPNLAVWTVQTWAGAFGKTVQAQEQKLLPESVAHPAEKISPANQAEGGVAAAAWEEDLTHFLQEHGSAWVEPERWVLFMGTMRNKGYASSERTMLRAARVIWPKIESELKVAEEKAKQSAKQREEIKEKLRNWLKTLPDARWNMIEWDDFCNSLGDNLDEEWLNTERDRLILERKLGFSLNMVRINPGRFLMGSPESEPGRSEDETPHEVILTQPFEILTTPVTQALWKAVMGNSPFHFEGDDLPVEQVSWFDCMEFCNRLSDLVGLKRCYSGGKNVVWDMETNGYRLPTEAEWEYACRAGTTGPRYGDTNFIAWYKRNSMGRTRSVGKKTPNAWGIYDMQGNVWEWCWDWSGDYGRDEVQDPTGPANGTHRVIRGGSWDNFDGYCRSAARGIGEPFYSGAELGFRFVRTLT